MVMEYIKTCHTNVQVIGEYNAVRYQSFSVKAAGPEAADSADGASGLELIQQVEALLRDQDVLVAKDVGNNLLWVFHQANPTDPAGKPKQETDWIPNVEGYTLAVQAQGELKASELLKTPGKSTHTTLNTPPASTANTVAHLRNAQISIARNAQPNNPQQTSSSDQQRPDLFAIYEFFVASVVGRISLQLVRKANLLPLNYRTFLSTDTFKSKRKEDDLGTFTSLITLDVQWTSGGTLILSWLCSEYVRLQSLSQASLSLSDLPSRSYLRIAPSGAIARFASLDPPDTPSRIGNGPEKERRKRARTRFNTEESREWKSAVESWLRRIGINIGDFEDRRWTRVELSRHFVAPDTASSAESALSSTRQILWPASLCFLYNWPPAEPQLSRVGETPPTPASERDVSISQDGDPGLRWFQTDDQAGYEDPLDVSEQWFSSKPEREKNTQIGRQVKASEQGMFPTTSGDDHALAASSPLYLRAGVYADLQPVSGVYPTPPDGLPSQGVSTGLASDPPQPLPVPSHPEASAQPNGLAATPSAAATAHASGSTISQPPPSIPIQQKDGFGNDLQPNDDDLFEDMDEDVFGGNDVTDADFSFFDEPDDMEVAMDMPAPRHLKSEKEPDHLMPSPGLIKDRDVMRLDPQGFHDAQLTGDIKEEDIDDILRDVDMHLAKETASASVHFTLTPEHIPNETLPPNLNQPNNHGTLTPPLDKSTIQKQLFSPPSRPQQDVKLKASSPVRRESIFDPVSFNHSMSLTDAKYSAGGRFGFRQKLETDPNDSSYPKTPKSPRTKFSTVDTPSYAKKQSQYNDSRQPFTLARRPTLQIKVPSNSRDDDSSDSFSESDIESESDSDFESAEEEMTHGPIITVKRKWPEDQATPVSIASFGEISQAEDLKDAVAELQPPPLHTDPRILSLLEPTPWDWSLADYPPPSTSADPQPVFKPLPSPGRMDPPPTRTEVKEIVSEDGLSLSARDVISIAQVFSEQTLMSNLDLFSDDDSSSLYDCTLATISSHRAAAQTIIQTVVSELFPKAQSYSLLKYASIQDATLENQSSKQPQRAPARRANSTPGGGSDALGNQTNAIFPIAAPHIRVRRGETLWDLLPPALSFWEPLGLSPASEAKNVMAFCVHPFSAAITPAVNTFMDNIGLAYESCKLGNHIRGRLSKEHVTDGLFPCRVADASSFKAAMRSFRANCIRLGEALASLDAKDLTQLNEAKVDSFVIYMINPFESPKSIWHLCAAFWALFQAYGSGPQSSQKPSRRYDLVLQIVPVKHIASFDRPVMMPPAVMVQLAREVYDRCPPSAQCEDTTPLTIYRAPSIRLEETVPRNIQFKMLAEPPSDLLRENSYMHLGYAFSADYSWLTAAWTDNFGKYQSAVSYCLIGRSFNEVAREIWQTTVEIIQTRRVGWRLCIARAGVMEREEIEAWSTLATSPCPFYLCTALLSVLPNPPISLIPPFLPTTNTGSASNANSSSTPVSTPQPGVSPDPTSTTGLTPAATPSDMNQDNTNDPDARLVDVTDESWGVILGHRLNNSNSIVDYRPSLVSGLLVKRGSDTNCSAPGNSSATEPPPRGPVVAGVNLVWLGAVSGSRTPSVPGVSTPTSTTPSSTFGDGTSGSPIGTPGGQGAGGSNFASASPQGAAGGNAGGDGRGGMTWTAGPAARNTGEALLKEILIQYRGLGLLGRMRGMKGTKGGTLPWHVAAAMRGVHGLERSFGI